MNKNRQHLLYIQGSKLKKSLGSLLVTNVTPDANFKWPVCIIKIMFRFSLLKVFDIIRYGMGQVLTSTKIQTQKMHTSTKQSCPNLKGTCI